MLQTDNSGSVVAAQSLARGRDLRLFFSSIEDLATHLHDGTRMAALRESVWRRRAAFTFDSHTDRLLAFFRQMIGQRCTISRPFFLASRLRSGQCAFFRN